MDAEIEGQMSLDDATRTAQRAADRAVQRSGEHSDPEVLDWWVGVVWEAARRHSEFSTNAVFELAESPPRMIEPRAMGVVMRRAQRAGLIRPTDRYEPDRTPGSHARPKRIWRSLIWRES